MKLMPLAISLPSRSHRTISTFRPVFTSDRGGFRMRKSPSNRSDRSKQNTINIVNVLSNLKSGEPGRRMLITRNGTYLSSSRIRGSMTKSSRWTWWRFRMRWWRLLARSIKWAKPLRWWTKIVKKDFKRTWMRMCMTDCMVKSGQMCCPGRNSRWVIKVSTTQLSIRQRPAKTRRKSNLHEVTRESHLLDGLNHVWIFRKAMSRDRICTLTPSEGKRSSNKFKTERKQWASTTWTMSLISTSWRKSTKNSR